MRYSMYREGQCRNRCGCYTASFAFIPLYPSRRCGGGTHFEPLLSFFIVIVFSAGTQLVISPPPFPLFIELAQLQRHCKQRQSKSNQQHHVQWRHVNGPTIMHHRATKCHHALHIEDGLRTRFLIQFVHFHILLDLDLFNDPFAGGAPLRVDTR